MAGTLTISTLSDGTNSLSTTPIIQGACRAWVSYNGTNGAVRGSYNVSSVTYNSTGYCTVNFTNAMPDANYAIAGVADATGSFGGTFNSSAISASSCQLQYCQNNSPSLVNPTYAFVVIHR